MPAVSAALFACVRKVHFFCTQGSRVRPASGIPCALSYARGRNKMQSSDMSCRENADARLQCCLTIELDVAPRHGEEHVARMSQRVRAKRGPMTGSATSGKDRP